MVNKEGSCGKEHNNDFFANLCAPFAKLCATTLLTLKGMYNLLPKGFRKLFITTKSKLLITAAGWNVGRSE